MSRTGWIISGFVLALVAMGVGAAALLRHHSGDAETLAGPIDTPFIHAATMPASGITPGQHVVRVAIIAGMLQSDFWATLSKRFEDETHIHVELVAAGPKEALDEAVRKKGGVDLVTMHASDTIVNLVADGYAFDPQPWLRNDMILVGPADDPAGVRGMTDVADALRKIAAAKSAFVVHSSGGVQEVLSVLLEQNHIALDRDNLTVLFANSVWNGDVLKIAAAKHAYTMVGRIPFRTGKMPNTGGLVAMVQGDPRLRRPYMVAVINPKKSPDADLDDAKKLEAFLLSGPTQAWVAGFGRGSIDDQPLFFPLAPQHDRSE